MEKSGEFLKCRVASLATQKLWHIRPVAVSAVIDRRAKQPQVARCRSAFNHARRWLSMMFDLGVWAEPAMAAQETTEQHYNDANFLRLDGHRTRFLQGTTECGCPTLSMKSKMRQDARCAARASEYLRYGISI